MTRRAIVVGSGPNGLSAAIVLAQAGLDVTVLEAEDTIGGGMRSAELTLPGFVHDVCSAVHPMAVASPFFTSLPLAAHGLQWIEPPAEVAHPLDDGTAVLLERSIDTTADALGADANAYRKLFTPLVENSGVLFDSVLAPLFPPKHPIAMAHFALDALRSASGLAHAYFRGERAKALFAGIAGHAILPLDAMASASFALVLGMAGHVVGWPFPRRGSQSIADALAARLESLGGRIQTDRLVVDHRELAGADIVMFDVVPRTLMKIAGERLPENYRHRLQGFRHGPAVFKLDWALSAPIPWRAAECARAATVHLGGAFAEIARAEAQVANGEHAEHPYIILVQPSLFDDTRAPQGQHTAWAYCHVPNGSTEDMTDRIERQIERFAPGFRDVILARRATGSVEFERHNANYVGGDIVGGANDLLQTLARPIFSLHPYRIPVPGWFLCSASTPPGGGVHGMAGYHAATAALNSQPLRA